MASTPAFPSTPRLGVAAVSVANAGRDGTGTISAAILTGVAAGTRVNRIAIAATSDPADSIVTIFLHDGTNFFFFDEFDLGNPAAASTTNPAYRAERPYYDLVLPLNWSIRAAITVAPTAGVVNVIVMGGDLT